MKIKRTAGERIFEVLNLFFLTLVIVVTLYPFLHVLFASLSNPNLLSAHTGIMRCAGRLISLRRLPCFSAAA